MTAPPREPTPKMITAAYSAWRSSCHDPQEYFARIWARLWRAMYDAAPAPSADNKPTPGMLRGLSKIAADLAAYRNGTAPSAEPPAQAATERMGTHWETCATDGGPRHYDCALRLIEQQAREIAELHADKDAYHYERAERAKVKP